MTAATRVYLHTSLTDATMLELVDELYSAIRDSPVRHHGPFCQCHWCKLQDALLHVDRDNLPSWGK